MSPGSDAQPSVSSAAILPRLRPPRDRTDLGLAAFPGSVVVVAMGAAAAWAMGAAAGGKGFGGTFSMDMDTI
jgi:hypothetical protein